MASLDAEFIDVSYEWTTAEPFRPAARTLGITI
jgi:hypothetical protein